MAAQGSEDAAGAPARARIPSRRDFGAMAYWLVAVLLRELPSPWSGERALELGGSLRADSWRGCTSAVASEDGPFSLVLSGCARPGLAICTVERSSRYAHRDWPSWAFLYAFAASLSPSSVRRTFLSEIDFSVRGFSWSRVSRVRLRGGRGGGEGGVECQLQFGSREAFTARGLHSARPSQRVQRKKGEDPHLRPFRCRYSRMSASQRSSTAYPPGENISPGRGAASAGTRGGRDCLDLCPGELRENGAVSTHFLPARRQARSLLESGGRRLPGTAPLARPPSDGERHLGRVGLGHGSGDDGSAIGHYSISDSQPRGRYCSCVNENARTPRGRAA